MIEQSIDLHVALLGAVERNDLATATHWIKAGADVNRRGPTAYTPLMVAAGQGLVQMTDLLLHAGADVHVFDGSLGASALHKAAQSGVVDVARLLLDQGAFINIQSATVGHTPLIDAVWSKRVAMVRYLLERGAALTIKGHHQASVWDFVGREPTWTAGFTTPESEPWGKQIRALLDEHQAKNDGAVGGQTIMQAVMKNDNQGVRRAIAAGADVNERSPVVGSGNDGQTPLLVACFLGHAEVVRTLLGAGANPRIVDYLLKATPAHKAAYAGRPEALRALIEQGGVELDAQGPYNGYTALHDGVWHGHPDIVKLLLAAGVRTDLRGFDGNTPADLARALGYQEMEVMIREKSPTAKTSR
jgi:ankyrin repeat protein